ncbi:MAG: phospholipase D-like domain-containing protein [Myxococcales bacterium]|nr:phospholipase D-like domain-containing protein [Myxococcales bacterium]
MLGGNRVCLYHDGDQCLPAMLAAIEEAREEILLEMYWFDSDATGRRFAEALCEKARQGVRVCVTYDAVGSFEADRDQFERMCAAGCQVFEYRPVHFWRPRFRLAGLNRRNHRKMLVVDGRLGMTGGVNLGDAWAPFSEGGGGFRDDMIAIEGPAVADMREIFFTAFRAPGWQQAQAAAVAAPASAGGCKVRVVANHRLRDRRAIERAYLRRIHAAQHSILITNSYFIPGREVRLGLARAVERGVRVQVLLPVDSDVFAVRFATHRLYGWMLRRGIELYEWGQSILHSKTAVIDGRWCTVGTHNLDYRSWAFNLEINVTVEDAQVAAELQARMQRDMDESVPVQAGQWRFRPLGDRLLELLFYRFRRLL